MSVLSLVISMSSRLLDAVNDDRLEIFYDQGFWFQMPRLFLAVMSEGEAILLAYLINQSWLRKAYAPDRKAKAKGWFICKKDKIQKDIFMNFKRQQRIMSSLGKRGFVHTKMRGLPAKRLIKINFKKIHEKVLELNAALSAETSTDSKNTFKLIDRKQIPRKRRGVPMDPYEVPTTDPL